MCWVVFSVTGETNTVKGNGKALPLQAWSGSEGSRKLRFQDFVTTAQDGGIIIIILIIR